MGNYEEAVNRQYGVGEIISKISDGLDLADKSLSTLRVDDLSPIDEFHTRGRTATREATELVELKATDVILDVGCGLGGTARHLAEEFNCRVIGIDLTEEYISVGTKLTELVALTSRVTLHQGNALSIPYGDQVFDIVWTEHAQMNIEDKNRFYSEVARVLKPQGWFLFHDIFMGINGSPHYPVPWADKESISALVSVQEVQRIMGQSGFRIVDWTDKTRESIDFFESTLAKIETYGQPPLGIHLLMGNTAREKIQNYCKNLLEHHVTVVLGTAQRESTSKL